MNGDVSVMLSTERNKSNRSKAWQIRLHDGKLYVCKYGATTIWNWVGI